MIEAAVNWTDKDRYVGSATSRHSIVMDTAPEKTANTPMELVLLGLCGCTASDVVGILRKKREPFTGLEVRAEAERADGYPAVYTSIHLTYLVQRGGIEESHGRRGPSFKREVLLGFRHAGEDRENHLHHRARCVKAGTHPLRGYFYICECGLSVGDFGDAGSRGIHWASAARRVSLGESLRKIDPLILSQSRATLSLAVLLPVLLVRRGASVLRVPGRDLVRFFVLGVLGVAASNYLYYLAIQRTNVATAIILQYTAPVWVLLYTVARGAQRPSLRRSAAVGLAVAGCALAVGFVGSRGFRMDADRSHGRAAGCILLCVL